MLELIKSKTALVIVDMQNDFVRPGAPMCVDDAAKTVGTINRLIDFARSNSMPVIYTKFVTGPKSTLLWHWSPQIEQYHACRRGFTRYYEDIGKSQDCCDVIDELYPKKRDYMVEKYWYSAFRNTNLADILQSEGCDTIIITGTVTQICVADTAHEAFSSNIKVLVARDAVSSFSPSQHESALENINIKFGMVLNSDEIILKLK